MNKEIRDLRVTFKSGKKIIFHCALTNEGKTFINTAERLWYDNDLIVSKVVRYRNWQAEIVNPEYCKFVIEERDNTNKVNKTKN